MKHLAQGDTTNARRARPLRSKLFDNVHIILAAICIVLIILLVATKGFGITESRQKESLDDYAWAELQAIAKEIENAPNDETGIKIAAHYNLCNEDGTFDPNASKKVTLSTDAKAYVRIIGIRHDDKADGSGKAGLTFCFTAPIVEGCFNVLPKESSGWESSDLCAYTNSSDLWNLLPADMKNGIKSVMKSTNDAGVTDSTASVKQTGGFVWILSAVEYNGVGSPGQDAAAWCDVVNNIEGRQYQYFKQANSRPHNDNATWTRSADCSDASNAWALDSTGQLYCAPQDLLLGITPAFCY